MSWQVTNVKVPVTGNNVTNEYLQELSKQLNKDIFAIDKVAMGSREVNVEGTSYITKDGQVIYFNIGDFDLSWATITGINFYDSDGNSLNDLFYSKFLGKVLGFSDSTVLGFYIKYGSEEELPEEPLLMSSKNTAESTSGFDGSACLVNVKILYDMPR